MTQMKPQKPLFRLVLSTPDGPISRPHRLWSEMYKELAEEKQRIADGSSRTTRICIDEWDTYYGWVLYQQVYPEEV